MKIAIHHRGNSFSDHWIGYCKRNGIDYKIVNAYDNDIICQLDDCDIFMWHHHQSVYKDTLFANQLLYSLQKTGKITYPDFNTTWHFDDKIGQRYLLESEKLPQIPTYIFYNKEDALAWIEKAEFPKVFKLRCGASSANVMLVKDKQQARRLVKKTFGNGIKIYRYKDQIKERYRKYKMGLVSIRNLLGLIRRSLFHICPDEYIRFHNKEFGYAYFQDFLPYKNFDIRVFVIGNRAIAKKRMNRPNDFRASGGNNLIFDKEQIDTRCVQLAFEANKRLKMQSVAFDFIFDKDNMPKLSEISYCSVISTNKNVPGYWTSDMEWHQCDNINICDWIIEDLINEYKSRQNG